MTFEEISMTSVRIDPASSANSGYAVYVVDEGQEHFIATISEQVYPEYEKASKLSPNGYKIFLDRYALKDGSRESLSASDLVLAVVDEKDQYEPQREIGRVKDIREDEKLGKMVTILFDHQYETGTVSTTQEFHIDKIDKPLETSPIQMHIRLAATLAYQERPKLRSDFFFKFLDILSSWKYVPAGRIQASAGTGVSTSWSNCFVLPPPHDSRNLWKYKGKQDTSAWSLQHGIDELLSVMSEIFSRGGGCGIPIMTLRPRRTYVKGVNGRSSGSVSWAEEFSRRTGKIEQGGSRRGALLLLQSIWHPDIEEFINCKREMGFASNCNVSVGITDDFMQAVENDEDWSLKFPETTYEKYDPEWDGDIETWQAKGYPIKTYKVVKARELWQKIIDSAWASAEPGLLFVDTVNRESNSYYYQKMWCCNPCGEMPLSAWGSCVTGDTLIAVADGRQAVSIEQLTTEGKDVPVFCSNSEGRSYVRWGRHFRKTGSKQEVWKVTLDDGTSIKTTPKHKFIKRDGSEVQLQHLTVGDSLMPFGKARYLTNNRDDWWIRTTRGKGVELESHILGEFILDRDMKSFPEELAHHKDENHWNNDWRNIEIKSNEEHSRDHSSGERNPMFGKKHSEETKKLIGSLVNERLANPDWREKWLEKVREGVKNGKQPEVYERTPEIRARLSESLSGGYLETSCLHCSKKFITSNKSLNSPEYATFNACCSESCYINYTTSTTQQERRIASSKAWSNTPYGLSTKKKAASASTLSKMLRQGKWILDKYGKIDPTTWDDSRQDFRNDTGVFHTISSKIVSKIFNNDWRSFQDQAQEYNHKIINIQFEGYEDVYNLTVDEFHNYAVVTDTSYGKNSKKANWKGGVGGIIIANCNLSHINLSKYYDKKLGVNINALREDVKLAVRFADNVIDSAYYFMPEIEKIQKYERRIGLGTLGDAELQMLREVRFGSIAHLTDIESIAKIIACAAYEESIELAKEKGPCQATTTKEQREKFVESGFMKRMPGYIRQGVLEHGIRNITLLTEAPTGTVGTMVQTSTGIEPYFSLFWKRRSRVGAMIESSGPFVEWCKTNKKEHILDLDNEQLYEMWKKGEIPDYFICASWLTPEEHAKTQAAWQRWVDAAISKTSNLPADYTPKQVGSYYKLMYNLGCKGGTVYRDGSRSEQILSQVEKKPEPEARSAQQIQQQLIKEVEKIPFDESKEDVIQRAKKVLDKVVEAPTALEAEPSWELIATPEPGVVLKNDLSSSERTAAGRIHVRMRRHPSDDLPFDTFLNLGKSGTDVASLIEAIGRLISLVQRMNSPIEPVRRLQLIVDQLEGIGGTSVGFGSNRVASIPDGIARAIRNIIGAEYSANAEEKAVKLKPNTVSSFVGKDVCPKCHNMSFLREGGCQTCQNCGFSKC
jgi:ribonucleotide reductase alpha subunit